MYRYVFLCSEMTISYLWRIFFKPHIDHLEIPVFRLWIQHKNYYSNVQCYIVHYSNVLCYIALQHVSGIEKLFSTVCLDCDSKSWMEWSLGTHSNHWRSISFNGLKNLSQNRWGDTCTPMADSCQCMAKPPQYCKVISFQLKEIIFKKYFVLGISSSYL